MASMTEHEVAALQLMKAENELRQLRFENKWLRDANKSLNEEIKRLRGDKETLATGSFV